jgi:hypothetical protein
MRFVTGQRTPGTCSSLGSRQYTLTHITYTKMLLVKVIVLDLDAINGRSWLHIPSGSRLTIFALHWHVLCPPTQNTFFHPLNVVSYGWRHKSVMVRDILVLNSVAFSPQADYTDWATATWRNLVPTFADRVVSCGQRGGSPKVVNLSFLDRNPYFSFK